MESALLSPPLQRPARSRVATVVVDLGIEPIRLSCALTARLLFEEIQAVQLVGRSQVPSLAMALAEANIWSIDPQPAWWFDLCDNQRAEETKELQCLVDALWGEGLTVTSEMVRLTLRRTLRLARRRWPSDILWVATEAARLPRSLGRAGRIPQMLDWRS